MTIPAPGHSWLDIVEVQRFNRLYDATPSATVSLGTVLDHIVEGKYAPLIERARHILATRGEKAYSVFKRRLPQITFAGVFAPTRAKANLGQHSGIVHADLDHLSDLQETKLQLMQDPHVVYVFRSPSWAGLKYGVKVDIVTTDAAYQHVWQVLAEAHLRQYNVTWDPSGKDVCRLCFVSWDPSAYLNPEATVFPVPPRDAPETPHTPSVRFHAPYARAYGETAAARALARARRSILASHPGERHHARCKAAYLIGGYVGAGLLAYDEAYAALETAVSQTSEDIPSALRTIQDGLTAGAARPLTVDKVRPIPPMTTINATEVPAWLG